MIGERHLPHGFDMLIERAGAVHRIDGRDHGADAVKPGQRRIGQERLNQRRRIGKPRCLDHHVIEARNLAVLAGVIEVVERGHEIAEHGAAQAAVLQNHDGVVALRRQKMIETDFANR